MKKNLVFEFVRYTEIESLKSDDRVAKLLEIVKEDKIILLEGRLKREEEALLIQRTMESISKNFKGIEIAVLNPSNSDSVWSKIKEKLALLLLGDRDGITLIGPASVIRDIKQNPQKLNQLTIDLS